MIVNVSGIDFPIVIIYKRNNKKIYLRVKNGTIHITTPTKLTTGSIKEMIEKNFTSIVKVMRSNEKIEDEIHFLGELYLLEVNISHRNLVYIQDDKMVVECRNKLLLPKLIDEFYNASLQKIVEKYADSILKKFGINYKISFQFKSVKGYFGECFPKSKKIFLSSKLAKYELRYILSVIYHEAAHFKVLNHQQEFYDYIETVYPNYRKVQSELRRIKYQDAY